MKHSIPLLAILCCVASSAHAASVSITFDQATYNVGDTATLSVVGTASAGELAVAVFGDLLFSNPPMVVDPVATQAALVSFGGAITWVTGTLPCDSTRCTAFNQIGGLGPLQATNTPLVISTITFTVGAVGVLDVAWDPTTFDFFGAVDQPGTSTAVVPEPASAALLALGLAGLAATGGRRRTR